MVTATRVASGPAVVRVAREHADALAEFYRQTWDANASRSGVLLSRALQARSNPHGRDVDVPTFVFMDRGRVVGHLTTIPILLWNGQTEIRAHWLKGLMVLPEYRNGPVGFMLVREALSAVELAFAAVVAPDARRLFTALGFADHGVLANTIRILEPAAVIRRLANSTLVNQLSGTKKALMRAASQPVCASLAGASLSACAAAYTSIRGRAAGHGRIAAIFPEPTELNELWLTMRAELVCAPARGAEYLTQRYGIGQGYRWLTVYRDGKLRGLAVLRPPALPGDARLNGVRVATLSEVIARPSDRETMLDLLQAAEQVARGLDAHVLVCSASHTALLRLLRSRAYLPYPGNVHVLIRPKSQDWPNIDTWWFTRGDSAADEAF